MTPARLFLGGRWQATDRLANITNPASGEVCGQVCPATVRTLRVGAGLVPGIQAGPGINKQGLEKALEPGDDALERDARALARGRRLKRAGWFLEPGTIGCNDGVPSTSQCPFGGLERSGPGRELGLEGLEAFLETKRASIGISSPLRTAIQS